MKKLATFGLSAFLLLLGLASSLAQADVPGEPAASFYVVEIANFGCAHCRAMENVIPSIAAAAKQAGGKYVFGPIVWDSQTTARDQVYYAARLQGPVVEQAVRASLFRGIQDNGLLLEDSGQAIAWLQQDVGAAVNVDFAQLAKDTADDLSMLAEVKAARLATAAGISKTPSFIFLKNGKIVTTLSADSGEFSATNLATKVKTEIVDISKP